MEKTVKTSSKTHSKARAILIPMAITVSIATLYFLITMYTPQLSFTNGDWAGFRLANVLKALAIVTPWAGPGIGLAAVYNADATAKITSGIYWFLPLANTAIGYGIYRLAQFGPKKGIKGHIKNILLLIVYAVVIAIVVKINHTLLKFPAAFFMPKAQAYLWAGIVGKSISSVIGTLLGYPLIGMWNRVKDKMEQNVGM